MKERLLEANSRRVTDRGGGRLEETGRLGDSPRGGSHGYA